MVQEPGPSLEGPEKFSHLESKNNVLNLMITEMFFHVSLIWTEAPFIQEVSASKTYLFLDTDELKIWKKNFRGFRETGPRMVNMLSYYYNLTPQNKTFPKSEM